MKAARAMLKPLGKPNEELSKRYDDGSAFLVYDCGTMVLVRKRAPYSASPSPLSCSLDKVELNDVKMSDPPQSKSRQFSTVEGPGLVTLSSECRVVTDEVSLPD